MNQAVNLFSARQEIGTNCIKESEKNPSREEKKKVKKIKIIKCSLHISLENIIELGYSKWIISLF